MRWLAATALLASAGVAVAAAGSAASPSTPLFHGVDKRLCPFPLEVTVRSVGPVDPAAPTVGRFTLFGGFQVTLRNGRTGRSAAFPSPGTHAVDTRTGAVSFRGSHVWYWDTGAHVPFAFTMSKGAFSPDAVLTPGTLSTWVIDPCAYVDTLPGGKGVPRSITTFDPAETPAPWPLPPYALSRIDQAGLTPLLGRVIRHDHVHLDVIVDGRAVKVPGGIGLAEPVDGGACPEPKASGDCATGETIFAAVANSPLHTHASSGLIHIESDRRVRFTLGQVFDEWGVRLARDCLGAYCAGGGKELRVYVNGRRVAGDPRRLVLLERQEIAVVFGDDFGSVPSRYAGRWPGPGCGGPGEESCLPPSRAS
jgi:hypothetical protein